MKTKPQTPAAILRATAGDCVASNNGQHSVARGDVHCHKCGAQPPTIAEEPAPSFPQVQGPGQVYELRPRAASPAGFSKWADIWRRRTDARTVEMGEDKWELLMAAASQGNAASYGFTAADFAKVVQLCTCGQPISLHSKPCVIARRLTTETAQEQQEQQTEPAPTPAPIAEAPRAILEQQLAEHQEALRLTRQHEQQLAARARAFMAIYAAGETLLEFWTNGTAVQPGSDAAADFRAAMERAQTLTH